jgi:DNA-binding transcriptional regulator GbsR (MarR family)
MKSPAHKTRHLASSIGDFIRYWGFRRIHGQIWTEVYLSKSGLSGADLTRILCVSKALVSPALKELLKYDLIRHSGGDAKTRRYTANPDVFSVIRKILLEREQKILLKAQAEFEKLPPEIASGESDLDPERLKKLGTMIQSANAALAVAIQMMSEENFSSISEK